MTCWSESWSRPPTTLVSASDRVDTDCCCRGLQFVGRGDCGTERDGWSDTENREETVRWRRLGGSLGIRDWSENRLGVDYIYRKRGKLDHPIEIRRTRINRLGSPNKKTVMFCRRLGMIRTQRWRQIGSGPGQLSDAHEEAAG